MAELRFITVGNGVQCVMMVGISMMLTWSVESWASPEASGAPRQAKYGQASGTIWMNGVNCQGYEPSLKECTYDADTSDCSHSEDASVECEVMVRLVNGGASYGRVEVYYSGQWAQCVISIGI